MLVEFGTVEIEANKNSKARKEAGTGLIILAFKKLWEAVIMKKGFALLVASIFISGVML